MRSLFFVVLALGLGLHGAPLAAQDPAEPDRRRRGDPLELLLAIAGDLELTQAQATRIREIQRDLEVRNRPLVERLVEVQRRVRAQLASSGASGRRSRPTRTQLDIARPPMRQIQVNNRRAMEEVGALLTADQKNRAAELLDLEDFERGWRSSKGP
jgi:Spy/CpxP family protein refolding chaperone